MVQVRRNRGNVIGEYPRVKACPRQRDIGEPAVDEFGMGGMIHVHQHTVCRQSLGTVAGDGVTMIEVTYSLSIEGERLADAAVIALLPNAVLPDLLPKIRTRRNMIFDSESEREMSKSKHTEAQMIGALKQLEAGRKAEDVAREMGVSKYTIYAWKSKYGGMDVSEAQEARQLRDASARLKKLVADLSLDKEALQSVIRKNGWGSQL
jgi:putative transposase